MSSGLLRKRLVWVVLVPICLAVGLALRPVLRGLAGIVVDAALVAVLLVVVLLALRRSGLWRLGSLPEPRVASPPAVPSGPPQAPPPPSEPEPEPPKRDRAAEVEAELKELKRRLGKE